MSHEVYVNDTVRIRVSFSDTDANGITTPVEPAEVNILITDSDSDVIVTGEATSLSSSIFYYDFTPTEADTYSVKFTGILTDGNSVIVQQTLYVSSSSLEYQSTVVLGKDQIIMFGSYVDPLYIDPEEVLPIFPDATKVEIGEIIHKFSLEVKNLLSLNDDEDGSTLPFIASEYIRAATACELSRTYEFGGDDENSVTIGDLTIVNRSAPRNLVNRDNATTWCQIATAYRKEMLANKIGPTAMQPRGLPGRKTGTSGKVPEYDTGKIVYLSDRELYGPGRKQSTNDDPMPDRDLRSYD